MADHFLSKIRVDSADFVQANGKPVLEQHDALRALLADRAGPEVADLFAEPLISKGNDEAPPTVSWYSDRDGEARPLAKLSPAERDRAEAYLADHLRPLRALAEDPATADLALGALSVYQQDDIVVVGDRPMIVNWGLLPGGMGANATARPAHYNATLGQYLPLKLTSATAPPEPPRTAGVAAAAVPVPPGIAATSGSGDSGGNVPPADPGPTPRRGLSPIAWVPLLVLLVLAGAVLAWLLMPGTRLYHANTPPAVTDAAALQAARAFNDSLRSRQQSLEVALDGAVCRPDGVLILPGGLTPEGLTPPALGVTPEREARAAPDALLPNSADRVLVPDPTAPAVAGKVAQTTLLSLIEARTVLVLAARDGKLTTGSGLVVGPGLIVTNQHVIEPALGGGQILVTGAGLEQPLPAEVLKSRGPLAETGADFALLQVDGADLPAFTVHRSSDSLKLTNVVAAGFPGDVLELDISFAALKSGDLSAVPELTVTDGSVNTEQKIGPETHVLMHSAALSAGNSGGPLVDMCGRLVGVNTFVRQGRMQNRGFALTTGDLLAFLAGTPAAPAVVSEPCAPLVVSPQVAQAAAPADAKPAAD